MLTYCITETSTGDQIVVNEQIDYDAVMHHKYFVYLNDKRCAPA